MAMTPALNESLWLALPASQRSRFDKPPLPEASGMKGEQLANWGSAWADQDHHLAPNTLGNKLAGCSCFPLPGPVRPIPRRSGSTGKTCCRLASFRFLAAHGGVFVRGTDITLSHSRRGWHRAVFSDFGTDCGRWWYPRRKEQHQRRRGWKQRADLKLHLRRVQARHRRTHSVCSSHGPSEPDTYTVEEPRSSPLPQQ